MDIDFKKIRPLNASRRDGFEEICCQLARLELQDRFIESFESTHFHRKSGEAGDAGVECYYVCSDGTEWGWQAKYFIDGLGDHQWRQIDESVKTALEKHPRLVKYIICLPINLSDPRVKGRKFGKDRWNEHVEKWKTWADELGVNVQFDKWEESALRQKLVQRADEKAGYIHYWFDEKFLTQDWFEQRLIEAVKDAGPRYTADLNFELPIAGVFDALGRTDEFLRQFHAFYSELYRRWNRAKSWGLLGQTLPEVAAAVDGLCQKVEDIGKALDRSAVEPFEPIELGSPRRFITGAF